MFFQFKDQYLYDIDSKVSVFKSLSKLKKDKCPISVTAYAGILMNLESVKPDTKILSNFIALAGEHSDPYILTMQGFALCNLMYQSLYMSDTQGYIPESLIDRSKDWTRVKEQEDD